MAKPNKNSKVNILLGFAMLSPTYFYFCLGTSFDKQKRVNCIFNKLYELSHEKQF